MRSVFEDIKSLRSRTASDGPSIVSVVCSAISEIESLKPKRIDIAHRGRSYVALQTQNKATIRISRPFRKDLVDFEVLSFKENARKAFDKTWTPVRAPNLERFVYSAQEVIGCYLDLLHPHAARKVIGTVFESLIACSLNRVTGLPIGSGTVQIPNSKEKIRTDLGIRVGSDLKLLVATKTSTRERLSQPFVQKFIVDRVLPTPPKSILIVIGDAQRQGTSGAVQHTFTAGQFLLYWEYLTPLDGVYYIDVPPQGETAAFKGKIKRLKDLFSTDIKDMVPVDEENSG